MSKLFKFSYFNYILGLCTRLKFLVPRLENLCIVEIYEEDFMFNFYSLFSYYFFSFSLDSFS